MVIKPLSIFAFISNDEKVEKMENINIPNKIKEIKGR